MSWFSVLPVVATLLAEAPASVPPADLVGPIAAWQQVETPPATAPKGPAATDRAATHWYGGPAVAADAAELALLVGVVVYEKDYQDSHGLRGWQWNAPGARTAGELLVLSTLVSGAVVHGLHDHAGRAVGSIALRAGAWATGVLVLGAVDLGSCNFEEGCHVPSSFPAIIGIPLVIAMAIDDAVFAREPVPAAARAQASWIPTLRIQPGLALLGVGGAF
jgi:hypothetical protein